ncbi:CHAT domain-containing protein [Kutzneria albida]|uniref:CHAT domain-containing protein n=1 Tax=Kutzneria albida DSM 43870 TaxID=1449976 RepID=W5WNY5_9PSEU|nr:CHAT domain-containing protein [Kutzneria albida]AHH99884.1 hypothetical protein KALB_6525 [Kutzneria albida DSM 43870]
MTDQPDNHFEGTAREVVQAHHIDGVHINVHEQPVSAPFRTPRELPPDVPGFTGREAELTELDALLDSAPDSTAAVISAVAGTAGVGKTALAVRWAHRVRDRFPDGDLYVDLRGYDSDRPMSPDDALAGFLRSLRVDGSAIPSERHERTAQYRTLLAGRRVLVVLDNASSAEQVRPLLPGSAASFVLVTSRDSLAGLVARDGARRVDLDRLSVTESVDLLHALIGPRVAEEPGRAAELARHSAQLPLALRVTAELAVSRPTTPLAELVRELADEQHRLAELDAGGDERTAVRTVFSWSYLHLPEPAARVFRLLGISPVREPDVSATAALAGTDLAEARRLLTTLRRAHLVEDVSPGRFRMHDLLHAYAVGLAAEQGTEAERVGAVNRLFDHYHDTAVRALKAVADTAGEPGHLAWLEAEIPNMLVLHDHAQRHSWPGQRQRLSQVLHDCMVTLHTLGIAARQDGDLPEALRHFDTAIARFELLAPGYCNGIRLDQAEALLDLGMYEEAAQHLRRAIPLLRELGMDEEIAKAETYQAMAALRHGDLVSARRRAAVAVRLFERLGDEHWACTARLTLVRALVAISVAHRQAPSSLIGRITALAAEFEQRGRCGEAAVAKLLAARLYVRKALPQVVRQLLDEVPPPEQTTSIDQLLLLRTCRAELAVLRGDRASAYREVSAGLAELDRFRRGLGSPELVCGAASHGRELGSLAVSVVLRDPGASGAELVDWLERTRAQAYRYRPGQSEPRESASLAELGAALGERALVSFTSSAGSIFAVVVVDGRAELVPLGESEPVLHWAGELHADLDALAPDRLPRVLVDVVATSARRRAALLDELLLHPLAGLTGDRELVLVPANALHTLAWGALPSLVGRPVSVAPSATAWLSASRRRVAGPTVLVTGPGTPAELDAAELCRPHPGAVLLRGERATVRGVLGALDGAGLAHLATHGMHEPGNALFSHMELADGELRAHELTRLSRPPGHVVLGAAELTVADEGHGFAGALLVIGARTVSAAVSRVGLNAAATTCAEYHQLLARGTSPAVALAAVTSVDPLRRPYVCLGAG